MADKQIYQLTAKGSVEDTDRFPLQVEDGADEAEYITGAELVDYIQENIPTPTPFDYELLYLTGTNSSTANILTKQYTEVESGGGSYAKLPISPVVGQKVQVANTDGSMNLHIVCESPQFMYAIGSNSGSGSINPGVTIGTLYTFVYLATNKWVYYINTSV